MDRATQAEGARRVDRVLFEPLCNLGLGAPGGMTKAGFTTMRADVCARLAYMDALHLEALAEQIAANPAGRGRNRFPEGPELLRLAARIQPPAESVSPLMRAVFRGEIGAEALAEGWAPELLEDLRKYRVWPTVWKIKQLREAGELQLRRRGMLAAMEQRGQAISAEDVAWIKARRAIDERCRQIRALAVQEAEDV